MAASSDVRSRIRVGRRENGKDPSYEGFRKVLCLTPSTPYGCIGPYCLKDSEGRLMENIWQGWKVYPSTPKIKAKYSQWDKTIIWDREKEVHVVSKDKISDLSGHIPIKGTNNYLTPEYFKWREALTHNEYPVRYPVGNNKTKGTCLGILTDEELERFRSGKIKAVTLLGYVESRKRVYSKIYSELVRSHPKFKALVAIARKEKVLIIEVDGPHEEDIHYYIVEYGVDDDFIKGNTILATEANLKIMLEDTKHPYGHGYVLADTLAKELEK